MSLYQKGKDGNEVMKSTICIVIIWIALAACVMVMRKGHVCPSDGRQEAMSNKAWSSLLEPCREQLFSSFLSACCSCTISPANSRALNIHACPKANK